LAIAETGSFSGAARRLRVTQPTVSRRVAALEELLGRPLFLRDVEGARLTPEGERLLPAAEELARGAAAVQRGVGGRRDALAASASRRRRASPTTRWCPWRGVSATSCPGSASSCSRGSSTSISPGGKRTSPCARGLPRSRI